MRIDSFPVDRRLFGARTVYAEKWEKSALSIEEQGGYEWMACLLDSFHPHHILDIGCGTGNGIAALHKRFPTARIIALDENPQVISKAKARLEAAGARVQVVFRLNDKVTGDRSHSLTIQCGKLRVRPGINLVECDILDDPEIDAFLRCQRKFDAITVWLIGSHLLRYHECDALRDTINNPTEYRLHVQSVAFALASLLLRNGGALQIVDRGPAPETVEMQDKVLAMPRMIASETHGLMHVAGLKYHAYTEADTSDAVRMVDDAGNVVRGSKLAFISIIVVKQQC
jgi:SAM-dependent methyltransferase